MSHEKSNIFGPTKNQPMCPPQDGKKKDKVPGFFYNLKQMNPFAKKQPKERDPEAAAAAPAPTAAATDGDKEESKELLEKGEGEKGDEDKEAEKKDGEKGAEGECMIDLIIMTFHPICIQLP